MYEKAFQLKSRPFHAGSLAEFWCQTGNSAQAVEQICQTLDRSSGISLLIGGAGTGKTLVLDLIARRFASRNPEIVQIACSRLDKRRDVLQRILFELNMPCREMGESDLRLTVVQHFRSVCGQNGRHVLLLVDEAHNLDVELIDELRIVVESASRNTGRCHLVLAGTSRLEDHLNHTNLDTFNQRISCRAYLTAMDRAETALYVSQHLSRAGGGKREFFSEESIRELARVTGGIPRLVNQVCDQCLIVCANSGARTVDRNMVSDAWCDIQNLPRQTVESPATPSVTSGATAAASFEFGSLDDDDAAEMTPASLDCVESTTAELNWPVEIMDDDEQDAPIAPTNKHPVVKPVKTPGTAGDNPFKEAFSAEEPVQSQKPQQPSQTGANPSLKPNKPAFGWKESGIHTQIDASTMTEFPAFGEIPDPDSGWVQSGNRKSSGVSMNPICEEPMPEVSETIPMQPAMTQESGNSSAVPNGDDRDMLVSPDATIYEPTGQATDDLDEGESDPPLSQAGLKGPHKTGAIRMEYRQLFAQLRNEAS